MRKLWPFVGIALAVAGGIALAPFFWWVAVLAPLVALAWWQRRYWPFAVIGLAYCWPVWFAWRGEYDGAFAAAAIVTLMFFWRFIAAWLRPYWLKVFPD